MAELSAAIDESFGDHDSPAPSSNGRLFGGGACQISFASSCDACSVGLTPVPEGYDERILGTALPCCQPDQHHSLFQLKNNVDDDVAGNICVTLFGGGGYGSPMSGGGFGGDGGGGGAGGFGGSMLGGSPWGSGGRACQMLPAIIQRILNNQFLSFDNVRQTTERLSHFEC